MAPHTAPARVLIVEDNYILAASLAECLQSEGFEVVGPRGSVPGAIELLEGAERVDVAVLDVQLDEESSQPVATLAMSKGIPVLLMTGYAEAALPSGLQGLPVCTKPFNTRALVGKLQHLLAAGDVRDQR